LIDSRCVGHGQSSIEGLLRPVGAPAQQLPIRRTAVSVSQQQFQRQPRILQAEPRFIF
jgi:hypothetical protein